MPKAMLGYFATHIHDFPEPHGTLFFPKKPELGDKVQCHITEEWFQVTGVNHNRMQVSVKKAEVDTDA